MLLHKIIKVPWHLKGKVCTLFIVGDSSGANNAWAMS